MTTPSDTIERPETPPRWLHAWAVLTVVCTIPLLLLGAEVTTKKVGMVDPVGFRAPWHLLTVPFEEMGLGYLIEHSHRVAGFVVGVCSIALAIGFWLGDRRRGYRWLGFAVLGLVIVQGLLGGFRVQLNAILGPNLAFVHGLFAQLVFATMVSAALATSRGWNEGRPSVPSGEGLDALRRASLWMAGAVYLQIFFGAVLRHTESPYGPRLHLLFATVLVALAARLAWLVAENRPSADYLVRTVGVLLALVGLQVILGVESWLAKFAAPEWPQLRPLTIHPELLRSIHYLVGAFVFSTSVVLTLQTRRGLAWNALPAPSEDHSERPVSRIEGAL